MFPLFPHLSADFAVASSGPHGCQAVKSSQALVIDSQSASHTDGPKTHTRLLSSTRFSRCRGVGGLVDLAHAPLADEGGDIVMAEAGADLKGHLYLYQCGDAE